MKTRSLLLAILISFSLTIPIVGMQGNVRAQETQNEFVILYDEAHGQYFKYNNMSIAFDWANKTFQEQFNSIIRVVPIQDEFNRTNLQFGDLLFITNPGIYENGTAYQFEKTEIQAIKDFVAIGKSIVALGNPFSIDANISGHIGPLQRLVKSVYFGPFDLLASGLEANESTIIVDDWENDGNNTHVLTNSSYYLEHPIFQEPFEIGKAIVYAQAVAISREAERFEEYKEYLVGKTPYTSYIIRPDYTIIEMYKQPAWLVAREKDSTRYVVGGSTIMFSNLVDTFSNQTWVERADHKQIFANMLAWLLHLTPQEKKEEFLQFSFIELTLIEFVSGVVISAFILTIVFLQTQRLRIIGRKIGGGSTSPKPVSKPKQPDKPKKAADSASKPKPKSKKKQKRVRK